MRISSLVVLLFVVTLSTSFVSYPMKPVVAQSFDSDINVVQDNNCFFGGFFICSNSAAITESTLGNPPVGSATLHQTQLNECAGSEDPADPTSCSNFSGVELSLAFISSSIYRIK